MNYIHKNIDERLVYLRKQGYGIKYLADAFVTIEPLSSTYISTIHVLRVCHELKVPFSKTQVRTYARKVWHPDMGGTPKEDGYYGRSMFIKDCLRFAGNYSPIPSTALPEDDRLYEEVLPLNATQTHDKNLDAYLLTSMQKRGPL